jgi:type IV secretion/conjugal transfer VirB4 family ATPase
LKKKASSFCDLLNYAHFVDEGIILNKDGAFLITYQYQAPDLDSATPEACDALVQLMNRMFLYLGDGWMVHVDEIRLPATRYPTKGHFPDPVSRLIDEERAALYREEGMHFENHAFFTFVWKFPLQLASKTRYLFVEGVEREPSQHLGSLLTLFVETVERAVALLKSQLQLKQLTSLELMTYLTVCIQGEVLPVSVPPQGCYLDVALSRKVILGGYAPKIGEKYLQVLSLLGYLNHETMPGLLREIGTYPLMYRWSNRFIPLSEGTAIQEIKRIERNWHNKAKGLMGLLKEMISTGESKLNQDAINMMQQAQEANLINSNQSTRFGYWTSTLVLMHEDKSLLLEASKCIANYVEQVGFSVLFETINALEAWRGTLPGHGSCHARRLLVSSFNLAHSLPLSHIWTGQEQAPIESLLLEGSPAVFYGITLGQTPFRYHVDSQDVGHQVILGPTGSGKSTFLGLFIAQFLRYSGAQIFVFDKDFSHQALTHALGGYHYNIGQDSVSFAPLQALDTPAQQGRAQQFVENLILLQQGTLSPEERQSIHLALESMRLDPDCRSLTVLANLVQLESLRQALHYYTQAGQMPLLDAETDALQLGYLQTFEMQWLLAQKPEVYVPVLLYLFDQIEERLEKDQARRPTLLILEEAWLYLNHPIFVSKIRDWLKTLRKKNARVIFATQSLSDLYDPTTKTLTQVTATLLESCPTKVFLPHLKMDSETKVLYQKMGLNDRQIDIVGRLAVPKHHYYVTTPQGSRLIHLGLKDTPLARAFLGLSKEKSHQLMACQAQHQAQWLTHWLTQNGLLGETCP